MKDKIIPILMVLGFSMFCGFVVIASGLGGLTSPLNRLAASGLCSEQELQLVPDSSAYIPGEGTHQITAYCADKGTGQSRDVSAELISVIRQLQIATGFVSGLNLFAISMAFLQWAARRLNIPWEKMFQPSVRREV